jgi:hypothetical protein
MEGIFFLFYIVIEKRSRMPTTYIITPTPLFFTAKSEESIVKENGKGSGGNN